MDRRRYLRRLQIGDSPVSNPSPSQVAQPAPQSTGPVGRVYPPNPARQEVSAPYITSTGYYRSGIPRDKGGPGPGTLAEQRAIRATSLVNQGHGYQSLKGRDVEKDWEPALLKSIIASRPPVPKLNGSHRSPSRVSPPREPTGTSRPSHFRNHSSPPDKTNPFDAVLARHLLLHIIDLYFDYIYCLIPCLHRPTFMQDLHSHREEDDNQEEWTALVFSVVAATLVQLPRAFVSMPRKKVKALVDRCYGLGREYLNRDFEEVTVTRCKCIPIPNVELIGETIGIMLYL